MEETGYRRAAAQMRRFMSSMQFTGCIDGAAHELALADWRCTKCSKPIPVQNRTKAELKYLN